MSDTIKAPSETVRGRVITPADSDYDEARAVYNAMHDRRPRAVVQCVDSADVMAVVRAGGETGLDLAVRGGGHSVPGFGTVDDGLVVDLSRMKNVRVDPDDDANIGWVTDYYAAIHPHSGGEGGYVNFMSGDDDRRAPANYGANYERLAAVKSAYDPDNLFHINQNIVPANRR